MRSFFGIYTYQVHSTNMTKLSSFLSDWLCRVEGLNSDPEKVKFPTPTYSEAMIFCWPPEDPSWHFARGVGFSFTIWKTPMNFLSICVLVVIHCGSWHWKKAKLSVPRKKQRQKGPSSNMGPQALPNSATAIPDWKSPTRNNINRSTHQKTSVNMNQKIQVPKILGQKQRTKHLWKRTKSQRRRNCGHNACSGVWLPPVKRCRKAGAIDLGQDECRFLDTTLFSLSQVFP